MRVPFIDLKAQYRAYKEEIDKEIGEVLESAVFIGGEKVSKLESRLGEYTGSKRVIGCSSGTDALLLALLAAGVQEGDEVITTPFTFIATAEVIAFLKAKPVFVDIEENSYNIDPTKIEEKITGKTKAIIPVSLYGQPADMEEINQIAASAPHKIWVIEDACQSFGAEYRGKKSCNLSDIGCTSFFPSKPLGCYGDGGALFTSDPIIAKKAAMLKNHGQSKRYEHEIVGLNARLDAIQAAVLLVKLEHFEEELKKRAEIADRYTKELKQYVITPQISKDRTSVFAQYSIRVPERRKEIINKLKTAGIPTAVHYPKPLHLQKAFEFLGHKKGDFPIAEKISQEILSLPMSPFLSEDDQEYVIKTLSKAF